MFSKELFRILIALPEKQWRDAIWTIRTNGLIALAIVVATVMFAKVVLAAIVDAGTASSALAQAVAILKAMLSVATIVIGAVLVFAETLGLRRERLKNELKR